MKIRDYNLFAEQCVGELNKLQKKFHEKYDIDWYEKWFYSQSTGLFTLSTGDVELNFKYFKVGSFSSKSNTWKWSWDNDYTLQNIKEPIKKVKMFGEKWKFSKLSQGCFPSDEYEAWEFTAITAKLLNAIGVYRLFTDEHLQIFLIITEFIDNITAKSIKDKFVLCSDHEYRRRAFVCQHLNHTTKVGFEEAFETFEGMELEGEDDLQAWCNECEAVRQKEGEWNDRSMDFAKIKVVCEKCYFEMKELNLEYK